MDEHIPIGGSFPVLHVVLKLLAADGDVVEHEVGHQVIFLPQPVDVFPGAESRVHNVVVDHGKPPVAGGGEEGQHVHTAEHPGKVLVQHTVQGFQVGAHAVRIGDEHSFVFNVFHEALPSSRNWIREYSIKSLGAILQ